MTMNVRFVRFCENVPDECVQFVVIAARYRGKWILCKHKEREKRLNFPAGTESTARNFQERQDGSFSKRQGR